MQVPSKQFGSSLGQSEKYGSRTHSVITDFENSILSGIRTLSVIRVKSLVYSSIPPSPFKILSYLYTLGTCHPLACTHGPWCKAGCLGSRLKLGTPDTGPYLKDKPFPLHSLQRPGIWSIGYLCSWVCPWDSPCNFDKSS